MAFRPERRPKLLRSVLLLGGGGKSSGRKRVDPENVEKNRGVRRGTHTEEYGNIVVGTGKRVGNPLGPNGWEIECGKHPRPKLAI